MLGNSSLSPGGSNPRSPKKRGGAAFGRKVNALRKKNEAKEVKDHKYMLDLEAGKKKKLRRT